MIWDAGQGSYVHNHPACQCKGFGSDAHQTKALSKEEKEQVKQKQSLQFKDRAGQYQAPQLAPTASVVCSKSTQMKIGSSDLTNLNESASQESAQQNLLKQLLQNSPGLLALLSKPQSVAEDDNTQESSQRREPALEPSNDFSQRREPAQEPSEIDRYSDERDARFNTNRYTNRDTNRFSDERDARSYSTNRYSDERDIRSNHSSQRQEPLQERSSQCQRHECPRTPSPIPLGQRKRSRWDMQPEYQPSAPPIAPPSKFSRPLSEEMTHSRSKPPPASRNNPNEREPTTVVLSASLTNTCINHHQFEDLKKALLELGCELKEDPSSFPQFFVTFLDNITLVNRFRAMNLLSPHFKI